MGVASGRSFPGGILCSNISCIYIYMSAGRELQFPKRTSSSWGVPYRLSVFGNPSYLCIIFGNSRVLSNWPGNAVFCANGCIEQSFWCGRGGRRRGAVCVIILIVCVAICWLASVACVGLISSAYPSVLVFCNFLLVECLHRRLAACIFDLSLRIPHCSSLLALLYLPMSLDSGKRKSDTVRHTTWVKCNARETRHTYTWSIWCWQKRLQIWVFMMQSKAVVATGLSRQICHGFWVSVGIGWGIGGWYREYVKNCNVAINWRHANSQF